MSIMFRVLQVSTFWLWPVSYDINAKRPSYCCDHHFPGEDTKPVQETTTVQWQLVLGYRAGRWQRWNLTQSVLDFKTNAADWVPLIIGQMRCEWGTLHACVWPPSQHLQALSTLPTGCSLTHALGRGDTYISGAVCPGEDLPGKKSLCAGTGVGLSTVAKMLGSWVPPNEWGSESR